jgi:hypothetical protein
MVVFDFAKRFFTDDFDTSKNISGSFMAHIPLQRRNIRSFMAYINKL